MTLWEKLIRNCVKTPAGWWRWQGAVDKGLRDRARGEEGPPRPGVATVARDHARYERRAVQAGPERVVSEVVRQYRSLGDRVKSLLLTFSACTKNLSTILRNNQNQAV